MILNYLFSEPLVFVVWVLAILVALTVHEFAHAWAARAMGDNTAEISGRLSLNPVVHIDPMGFLLLLLVGFGWANPVPVNPNNYKNYAKGEILVSLAGPFSNLVLALFAGGALKLLLTYSALGPENLLVNFLLLSVFLNVILMLFNLIPIPPLDGSHVLFVLLPRKFNQIKLFLAQYGPMLLIGLLLLDSFSQVSVFGTMFNGILNWVMRLF